MASGPATAEVATGAAAAPRGRRPRALLILLVALVVVVAVVTAVAVTVAARSGPRTAQLCSVDDSVCAPLLPDAAATPRWALLPVDGSGRLEVTDRSLTGDVAVGVIAFLDASDASAVRVLPRTTTVGSVVVPEDGRGDVRLQGVPEGAGLVLVRTDGVPPADSVAPVCGSAECRSLQVSARTLVAQPSAAALAELLDARPGIGSAAARTAGTAVAAELASRAKAPARLTASLRPGDGRLIADWVLAPGGEEVSAIRVTVRAQGSDAVLRTTDAIAATGSLVLPGLDRTTRYLVEVAPVVGSGSGRVAGAAVELSGVPDGAPVAAGATTPSAPAGWKPLISQDFDRAAPLGTFADRYPGWSWYDGMTETSRETARPEGQVGIWQSRTTMSVHDGVMDCRVHTEGERPQVCALTPTPGGSNWRGQMYGRYTVRFKADPVPGYKIAWLLWPDSDDWSEGEIDFPEASLDGTITGSSHRNDGDPADFAYFFDTGQRMGGWHTATIDWRPGRLTYLLDGESWTTTEPAALPRVPMRWALQAETEIVDSAPDRKAQGHILIDWVAAWSRRG